MTDYLQPIGPLGRRLALVACLITTFVGAAVTVFAVAAMVEQRAAWHQGKPVWLGVCVIALLTIAAGWLSVRLWCGALDRGVTLMPIWFIQLFGALFFAGLVVLLFSDHGRFLLPQGIAIAAAMLLIRRQVRKRLQEHEAEVREDRPPAA